MLDELAEMHRTRPRHCPGPPPSRDSGTELFFRSGECTQHPADKFPECFSNLKNLGQHTEQNELSGFLLTYPRKSLDFKSESDPKASLMA